MPVMVRSSNFDPEWTKPTVWVALLIGSGLAPDDDTNARIDEGTPVPPMPKAVALARIFVRRNARVGAPAPAPGGSMGSPNNVTELPEIMLRKMFGASPF